MATTTLIKSGINNNVDSEDELIRAAQIVGVDLYSNDAPDWSLPPSGAIDIEAGESSDALVMALINDFGWDFF